MRSIIKLGLGIVAVLVFSIGMTASASASGFLATAKEKLLSAKVATQVFKTENGTVECAEAKIEGGESSTGAEAAAQLAFIEYGKCTAFGFVVAKITLADFLFENTGEVEQDNLVKITLSGSSCETSVPAQTVSTVAYDNNGKNILLLPNVLGIVYTASSCTHNGLFSNGTYTGNSETMIANGTLSFMGLPVPVWNATIFYGTFDKVEWPANSKTCYEATNGNIGQEPPEDPPWKNAACP